MGRNRTMDCLAVRQALLSKVVILLPFTHTRSVSAGIGCGLCQMATDVTYYMYGVGDEAVCEECPEKSFMTTITTFATAGLSAIVFFVMGNSTGYERGKKKQAQLQKDIAAAEAAAEDPLKVIKDKKKEFEAKLEFGKEALEDAGIEIDHLLDRDDEEGVDLASDEQASTLQEALIAFKDSVQYLQILTFMATIPNWQVCHAACIFIHPCTGATAVSKAQCSL